MIFLEVPTTSTLGLPVSISKRLQKGGGGEERGRGRRWERAHGRGGKVERVGGKEKISFKKWYLVDTFVGQ